jgi:hypothetical protein
VWALVGTWRSAGKYQGRRIWAILARFFMICGVVISIANVAGTIQTVVQISRMRNADDLYFHR